MCKCDLYLVLSHVLSNSCILRGFFSSSLIINITLHKQKSLRHKPEDTVCNIWYSKIMSKKKPQTSLEIAPWLKRDSCGTWEDVRLVRIIPSLQIQMFLKEIKICCHKICAYTHIYIYTHAHKHLFTT